MTLNKVMFIAGFTDADGYVGKSEIAIYDRNKALLNEICLYLKHLGMYQMCCLT